MPDASSKVIVRAATLTTLPERRVPSLRINVSADKMAASDTTHMLIAVAMTILLIKHFLLGCLPGIHCRGTADGDNRRSGVQWSRVPDRTPDLLQVYEGREVQTQESRRIDRHVCAVI